MSHGFESEHINSAKKAELIAEEKARHRLLEHLKDADLESPRFQAFCDYTDLQNTSTFCLKSPQPDSLLLMPDRLFNIDMIAETIRQRANGLNGYKRELIQVIDVTSDYWSVSQARFPARPMTQMFFASELLKIKEQEIARRVPRPTQ